MEAIVVSPLDPDWNPDGGAESGAAAAAEPFFSTAAPSIAPTPSAPLAAPAMPVTPVASMPSAPMSSPPVAPPAPAVPVAAVAPVAPVAPAAPAPVAPVMPAVPEQPSAPVSAPEAAQTAAPAAAEGAYGRSALEEDSEFEAGLLTDLLIEVLERNASDLHLTAGARPTIRINGSLEQLEDKPMMTPPTIQRMMYAVLTQKQREKFEEVLELDFAYAVPGKARFRVNLYKQRDAVGAAFRLIPYEIKPLEELGVPPSVANFSMLPRGFVLVTGPTGSGKSTTLASLVDLANRNRRDHIMTVEDPIEFLHRHKSSLVNQREVGEDTWSFQNALKHVLRQDPDIILVGEMRDLETISVALTAAETGHLVFATLHTQDAAQTIDRVIDVFPPHQQQQIRVQLAGALQGVVCQTLAKTSDGKGRAVATEVLVATPAIRNLIREGKTHQIYSALQAGAKHGMHTMDQHLAELVKSGRISYDTGLEKCHHLEDFNRLCGRA
ncbi:MAG TPA: type IV pilus twitching motility protein PilT [Mycobacteriales bacterium]|nr:type IV pilus twitching motility protein PilT [Mycobacteriales bacterium]